LVRPENIDVPLFGPNDPYHYQYDNLPLKNLLRRQALITSAVNTLDQITTDAVGTQGTLANRLNQSINPDGSLKVAAIDEALHSIEAHEDTDDYVRMQRAESDKLSGIASNATDVTLLVQADPDNVADPVDFTSGPVKFQSSSSVTFEVTSPNIVKAHLGFPLEAAHRHYYDITPVHVDTVDPDFINYKVNSSSTAYVDGSLRVYINGVRLTSSEQIYVPGAVVNDPWTLMKFTPDAEDGTFALSEAISEDDVLRIDYDIAFAE
jgi:hypothetical protein